MMGGGHHRAESAAVGDAESAAGEVFDGNFAVFGFYGVIDDGAFDVGDAHLVGVAQNRHDEAARAADGDADVEVAVVNDVFAINRSVHDGEFFSARPRRL